MGPKIVQVMRGLLLTAPESGVSRNAETVAVMSVGGIQVLQKPPVEQYLFLLHGLFASRGTKIRGYRRKREMKARPKAL